MSTFAFSRDGSSLVYRSGSSSNEQLYSLAVSAIAAGDSSRPVQITRHPSGVGLWQFAPDSKRIYFATADTVDADEKIRLEKRFDVRVRNAEVPVSSLWALDLATRQTVRLTRDSAYSVGDFTISDDGKWIGFHGISANRYERNILEQDINADLYLLEVASGQIERLTNNKEIGESNLSFSPDSRTIAFSAPDDFVYMHNARLYARDVSARGAPFRKLGAGFDGDVNTGFWSKDGRTMYFNEGVRATDQLLALDLAANTVTPVIHEDASVRVSQDEETGRLFISYSDPRAPASGGRLARVIRSTLSHSADVSFG